MSLLLQTTRKRRKLASSVITAEEVTSKRRKLPTTKIYSWRSFQWKENEMEGIRRVICTVCYKPRAVGEDSITFDEIREGGDVPEDWSDHEGNNLCWADVTSMCTPDPTEMDYVYRICRKLGFKKAMTIEELANALVPEHLGR
jgi:hypothetical protein